MTDAVEVPYTRPLGVRSRSSILAKTIVLLGVAILTGCAMRHLPEPPLPQLTVLRSPEIHVNQVTGERSLEFSVMIYNIADLPWPVRWGRKKQIKAIGAELARRRTEGRAPDIVMLQEAFTGHVRYLIEDGGYPNFLRGPARRDRVPDDLIGADPTFIAERRFWKGEKLAKKLDSGLYVLTHFPVRGKITLPFKSWACAGYDCLANKGVLGFSVDIPGLPVPVQVFTTHLNSWDATGVSPERSHRAHEFQVDHLFTMIETYRNPDYPLVFGGDFNMRGAEGRMIYAADRMPYVPVSGYCTLVSTDCDMTSNLDKDTPWKDTHDLHGFESGSGVVIRPIRFEALFDGPETGGRLSDHDAYLVTYEVTWKPEALNNQSQTLPSGLYRAGPGTVCHRDHRICYDKDGPSIDLTRSHFGNWSPDRAKRLADIVARKKVDSSAFRPTPGVRCDVRQKKCRATGMRCDEDTLACSPATLNYPSLNKALWPQP